MPRGIRAKAIKVVKRGRTKKYAGNLAEAAKRPAKPKSRVSAKNVVTAKFDALAPQVEKLMSMMDLVLKTLQMQLEIHKAGFLDAWRQYVEAMALHDRVADPAVYLKIFVDTANTLGITVKDLQEELKRFAPPAPVQETPPAPEPAPSETAVNPRVNEPVTVAQEQPQSGLNIL